MGLPQLPAVLNDFPVVVPPEPDKGDARSRDAKAHRAGTLSFDRPSRLDTVKLTLGASVSGLSAQHRDECRQVIALGAAYMLAKPTQVNYTQGAARWSAISGKHVLEFKKVGGKLTIDAAHHVLPFSGDCSSTDSWLLWLPLHHYIGELRGGDGVRDVVNGTNWTGGYTGTMVAHGKPVVNPKNWLVGDQVFYGGTPWVPEHVATFMGWKGSTPVVFTHGTPSGPYLSPIDYRKDRHSVRRYI
jgi:hypothetical protein